jgi:putative ABC transport system permease protein
MAGMWWAAVRDLQWRARRVVIAVLGTSLVLAMTLVMAGLTNAFDAEARRTVDAVGAEAWVMRAGIFGPFRSFASLTDAEVAAVRSAAGVTAAAPALLLHQAVELDTLVEVNVLGYTPGGVGEPRVASGRLPQALGEIVADRSLGVAAGETVAAAGVVLRVVGTVDGVTINAGQPVVFARIADAGLLVGSRTPVANAVLTRGVPRSLPAALAARTPDQVVGELVAPLRDGVRSIAIAQYLLWAVAALIVGSVVYLSALERVREFAVLKAVGWTSAHLLRQLALQAVVVSLASAGVAVLTAGLLAGLFPLEVVVPQGARLLLPLVALGVGLVACLAGLRRAVGVDPALAFGGP